MKHCWQLYYLQHLIANSSFEGQRMIIITLLQTLPPFVIAFAAVESIFGETFSFTKKVDFLVRGLHLVQSVNYSNPTCFHRQFCYYSLLFMVNERNIKRVGEDGYRLCHVNHGSSKLKFWRKIHYGCLNATDEVDYSFQHHLFGHTLRNSSAVNFALQIYGYQI